MGGKVVYSSRWKSRGVRAAGVIAFGTAWWYHRQSIAWREQADLHFTNAVYVNDWLHAEQLDSNKLAAGDGTASPTQSRIVPSMSPFRADDGLAGHIRTYYNRTSAYIARLSDAQEGGYGLVGGPNNDQGGQRRRDLINKWCTITPSPAASSGTIPALTAKVFGNAVGVIGECTRAYPPLTTHVEDPPYDVCVIGGGFAGLHVALSLGERGKKVVILEGKRIGNGASGRNGGDAIVGFHEDVDQIAKYIGVEDAKAIFKDSIAGYNRLKALIFGAPSRGRGIACEAVEVGAVTLAFGTRPTTNNTSKTDENTTVYTEESTEYKELLRGEQEDADRVNETYGDKREILCISQIKKRLGIDITEATFNFAYGTFNPRNISLNPLALCLGLARLCIETKNVTIHENSPVVTYSRQSSAIAEEEERIARARENHLEADRIANTVQRFRGGDWLVACDNGGTIRAKEIVFATNSASWSLLPKLAPCTLPIATAIMITKPFPKEALDRVFNATVAVFDDRFALSYFRRVADNRIMFGSLATGSPLDLEVAKSSLIKEFHKFFPSLAPKNGAPFPEPDLLWQGRLETRGPVVFPLVGRDDSNGVWYSLGYGGHGLVPTCAAGEVLASAITSITPTNTDDGNNGTSTTLLQPTDTRYKMWNRVTAVPEILQPSSYSSWRPPMLLPSGVFGPFSSMGLTVVIDYVYPFADYMCGRV